MVKKIFLIVSIIFLLVLSSIIPVTVGFNVKRSNEDFSDENYNFNRQLYTKNLDCYNADELPNLTRQPYDNISEEHNRCIESTISPSEEPILSSDGPMDSPWPMYCHDVRHTGRSPYSTANNPGTEKWWIKFDSYVDGSAAIDNNHTLYLGSWDDNFYAVDIINRSVKWKYETGGNTMGGPVIDEDGIIYVGTTWDTHHGDRFRAFYTNGTLKWEFFVGDNIHSSPAIGDDGTIYFGSENDYIYALYPNGTLKWKYKTSHVVLSSPAIGADGTVYCGSHDTYLYAFYPDNGTVKWKYKTGYWVRTAPCIGDDGTIYVVSLDDNLHAVNPDGTQKWKKNIGEGGTSPTIGQDGTIYCGYTKLRAVNPDDGSIKWSFDPGPDRTITGGTPCNSADGAIIFGTSYDVYHGELIAVNPDGTEKWRKYIGPCEFAPIIGDDGTIYVGSRNKEYTGTGLVLIGFLHVFGELDPDAPSAPEINGRRWAIPEKQYSYKFHSTSPLGRDIYYFVDWGDQDYTGWIGPFESGEMVTCIHTWREMGRYTIRVKSKDTSDLWGLWGYFNVNKPRDKSDNAFFLQFLERFPLLKQLFSINLI